MTNEHGLTDKQEEFAQLFVATGYAPAAYKEAYNTSKMSAVSIKNESYKLLKHTLVKERILNLKAEIKDATQVDSTLLAQGYLKMMQECEDTNDRKNWLKAADQLGKMLGMNAPNKVELGGTGNFSINYIKPLKNNGLNDSDQGELQK